MIHSYGAKVFFHTDGASEPLIQRLIDAGVDVLNPIQHVCPGMDCKELKAKYGDKLIFHGGVENQKILPFGTVEEVVAETKHCLDELGSGGYLPCSCHLRRPTLRLKTSSLSSRRFSSTKLNPHFSLHFQLHHQPPPVILPEQYGVCMHLDGGNIEVKH